jgi:REP element-mobilizing transposase RayT
MSFSEKFQNKYRIKSNRLQNYDYSSSGAYFITICTKNREHFFGKIINGKMVLNDLGKIVKSEWKKQGYYEKI